MGDVTSAVELCLRQIAQNDRYFWAYSCLGWAYLGKDELERARGAFEKALELNPNPNLELMGWGRSYEIDLFRLAHTLRLEKKYAEALLVLQRIPEIFPGTSADYDMGIIYQLMNDRAKANAYFERYRATVVEKDMPANPRDADNYVNLAVVNQRLGRLKEAQAAYQKAVALNPQLHFRFAAYLSVEGRPDEALQQLELAIQKGWRNYVWLKVHPDFQNLHADARFQSLLQRYIR